jgi:hypothetical protein
MYYGFGDSMVNENMIKICGFLQKYQEICGDMHQWKRLKGSIYPLSDSKIRAAPL